MKTCETRRIETTVGELIAALCEETENLEWLKRSDRQLVVALILNDLVNRAASESHVTVSSI
jgi:hypothetical protein